MTHFSIHAIKPSLRSTLNLETLINYLRKTPEANYVVPDL